MPAYLVSDSVTGDIVMVDAPRTRSAIKAVIDTRFTACELTWREVHDLTKKKVRLIDACTGEIDEADEEIDLDPNDAECPPAASAVEQPESPGERDEGLTAGETAIREMEAANG